MGEEKERADEDEEKEMEREPKKPPTKEELKQRAKTKMVMQRVSNQKLLGRLNAEILGYQGNVRKFLSTNALCIPDVPPEEKAETFLLLRDYVKDAQRSLRSRLAKGNRLPELLKYCEKDLPLISSFLAAKDLAIPVSIENRTLKLAVIYDINLAKDILKRDVFRILRSVADEDGADDGLRRRMENLFSRI